jgi:hypothetical protein
MASGNKKPPCDRTAQGGFAIGELLKVSSEFG